MGRGGDCICRCSEESSRSRRRSEEVSTRVGPLRPLALRRSLSSLLLALAYTWVLPCATCQDLIGGQHQGTLLNRESRFRHREEVTVKQQVVSQLAQGTAGFKSAGSKTQNHWNTQLNPQQQLLRSRERERAQNSRRELVEFLDVDFVRRPSANTQNRGGLRNSRAANQQSPNLLPKIWAVRPNGGGFCLDGSRPAYYFQEGSGSGQNSWIIYLVGGGWCFGFNDCLSRANTFLGSTKFLNAALGSQEEAEAVRNVTIIPQEFGQGILSPDSTVNPDFYNWNVAFIWHCDGSARLGQRGKVQTGNKRVILAGRPGIEQVLQDLLVRKPLKSATNALIVGCSAGGHTVSILCDYIRGLLSPSTNSKCLVDGGFFIDAPDNTGSPLFQARMQMLDNFQQAGNSTIAACRKQRQPWRCLMPEISLRYVKTSIFVVNSLYDYVALSYFYLRAQSSSNFMKESSLLACVRGTGKCSTAQRQAFLDYGVLLRTKIMTLFAARKNSKLAMDWMSVNSSAHCQVATSAWSVPGPDGRIMREKVAAWFLPRFVKK